jgi:molybdopterin molybdotransferase
MIDICNPSPGKLLSMTEALEKIKAAMIPTANSESVLLQDAVGRTLSAPVYSPINIPQDNLSSMDGYAFSSSDVNTEQAFTLNLIGTSWAGQPYDDNLQPGNCVRILTGALVPPGADSIIIQEQVQAEGTTIHFPANALAHQNIRVTGEDVTRGGLMCASPRKLTLYDIGLLASAGIAEVKVFHKIRIAFLSTGDELIEIGQALQSGKIYDSNRYLLKELLNDASFSVIDMGIIADDKLVLQKKLMDAAENFDVIVTTGGASVGDADFIHEILTSCGQINFWKLAIKPGKPLAFGKIGGCYFFGLPGNPVAVIVTFQQLVAPALRQLSGAPACKPLRFNATCTTELKKTPGRIEFQRGFLTQDDNGEFFVASSGSQGSHLLGSMSKANCFIILPAECKGIKPGASVLVEPFSLTLSTND